MAKKQKKAKNQIVDNKDERVKKVLIKTSKPSVAKSYTSESTLVFGRENYKWIGIGLALITIGMLLMIGGFNENPNEFDESSIYSMRRILLAPIVILTGLGVQVYAIFK